MARPVHIGALIAVWFAAALPAGAQDRMPPMPAATLTEAPKPAIEEVRKARGADLSGPFVPWLRSPEVMTRARAMGDYLRFRSALPPRLSEFVILLTARRRTQPDEWHTHAPRAVQGGLSPDIVTAIAEGRRPERLAPDGQAVCDLADELQPNRRLSDATYANAVAAVGEQGVIDTVALVGQYTMLAMVLNPARTPLPPGATPALPPFP